MYDITDTLGFLVQPKPEYERIRPSTVLFLAPLGQMTPRVFLVPFGHFI